MSVDAQISGYAPLSSLKSDPGGDRAGGDAAAEPVGSVMRGRCETMTPARAHPGARCTSVEKYTDIYEHPMHVARAIDEQYKKLS